MHSHNLDDQLSDQSDDQSDLINNAIISDEDVETSSSEKISEFDQFRNDYGFHVWYFGSPLGIAIADISIAGAKLGGTEALRVLAGGTGMGVFMGMMSNFVMAPLGVGLGSFATTAYSFLVANYTEPAATLISLGTSVSGGVVVPPLVYAAAYLFFSRKNKANLQEEFEMSLVPKEECNDNSVKSVNRYASS